MKAWKPDGARVLRHTVFGGLKQTVSLAVGVVLLPYMLARLGTERYGLLLTLQVLSMGGMLVYADAGLATGLTRFMADAYVQQDARRFRELLSTGIAAFLAIGATCFAIVILFGELLFFRIFEVPAALHTEIRIGIWIYGAAFLVQFPLLVIRAFFAGVQSVSILRLWETLERVTYALAIGVLLLFSQSVLNVVLVEQIVVSVLFLAFLIVGRYRFPTLMRPTIRLVSMKKLRELWPMSSRIFAYRLTFLAYERAPEAIIAALLGPVQLTWYAIIVKIPRALKGFGAAANSAAFPAAAALDSLDLRDHLSRLALRGARFGYLVVTPLVAFLIVFADEILRLWVGAQYAHLGNWLRALLVWQYMMFLVYYVHSTFTRSEQFGLLLRFTVGANIVFAGMLFATIKTHGLSGVMAAFLVSGLLTVAASVHVQLSAIAARLKDFFDDVLRVPVLGVGALSLSALWAARGGLQIEGLSSLMLTGFIMYAIYAPFVYRFALLPTERQHVLKLVGRG
jgi:O-antigen/teichoic acid export membrane protein